MPDKKNDTKDSKKPTSPYDFKLIADYIYEEFKRRKNAPRRKSLEKIWADIDRQIAMVPDLSHKMDPSGGMDPKLAWLPEIELPLQAQTLEVLTADTIRMQMPDSGSWFMPHAALTDEYLARVDFESIIAGDENEVPTQLNQDNADKLVQAVITYWQGQYDFRGNLDMINAEAFKYGTGVGRGRLATKAIFQDTARGSVSRKQKIPVLYPVSIKNTYPDDRQFAMMGEGFVMGPSTIFSKNQKLKDLQKAAATGGTDPDKDGGGWMPSKLKDFEGDKHGDVGVIEYEGDLIIHNNNEPIFHPNVRVWIVTGESDPTVFRLQFRKESYSTTILFPYHNEDMDSAYASSPLMKGWAIQVAAVSALSRTMEAAALKNKPPLGYDPDDMHLAQEGGPDIYPGAMWPSLAEIRTYEFGDAGASFAMYKDLVSQYYDVTGVNAPRLGAQTSSHTTAFAKEAELSRGTIRTVDYAKSTLKGALTSWLYMAYDMGRSTLNKTTMYVDSYGGFVTLDAKHLPDIVVFEAHGAGGPSEEQSKQARKTQAMQTALSLEQLRAQSLQLGVETHIDFDKAINEVLLDGGWTDLEAITRTEETPTGPAAGPGMAEDVGGGGTTAPGAALQTFSPQ